VTVFDSNSDLSDCLTSSSKAFNECVYGRRQNVIHGQPKPDAKSREEPLMRLKSLKIIRGKARIIIDVFVSDGVNDL
jgi:hypothetical protein